MSNPFDQFASEFSAALPPAAAAAAPYVAPPPKPPIMMTHAPPNGMAPGNPYGAPPPPSYTADHGNPYGGGAPSVDGAAGMYQQPPPYGGAYGAPSQQYQQQPPLSPSRGYDAAPPMSYAPASPMGQSTVPTSVYMNSHQEAPTSNAYADPWGAPTDRQPPAPMQAPSLPPLTHDSSAYGLSAPMNSQYGAAPATNPYGANPEQFPPMESNPYGAPEQNPYGAPPPPPPPPAAEANPYGAPPLGQDSNPYGAAPNPYGAAAPPDPQPPLNPYGAPEQGTHTPNPYGAPLEQMPPANPYGAPLEQPAPPNPYGAPPEPPSHPSNPYGPPMDQQPPNPYGAPPSAADQYALVPSQQQSNPYAAYGQAPPAPYGPPTPYGQPPSGLYGQAPPPNPYGGYGAPPPPPPVDPFSVFETKNEPAPAPFHTPAPESTALVVAAPTSLASGPNPSAGDDDFWGSFVPANDSNQAKPEEQPQQPIEKPERRVEEEKKGEDGLPPGGEWYDARIFTPTLGVMFFKPQELTDSLFLNADKDLVDGLGERPVVAFIVEGSSARSAGVELGHVLLKVNNIDVRSPKEASRLIKEGPRPLPLLFYVPNTEVVTAEGEHMVKYDTKETTAPNSPKDWKPKYVVIGGIIAQPWMINMYRSKVSARLLRVSINALCANLIAGLLIFLSFASVGIRHCRHRDTGPTTSLRQGQAVLPARCSDPE
jgi:hypothetical protein